MLKTNLFEKYKRCNVFIETGSFTGNGIKLAYDAGFTKIISIELSQKYYEACKERFKGVDSITCVQGDSGKVLWDIIKDINEPILFWLDGHWGAADTAYGDEESPLLKELAIIAQHPIKTHTLMIDDLRCWTKEKTGFDIGDIIKAVYQINKDYTFELEEGIIANDILICQIQPT